MLLLVLLVLLELVLDHVGTDGTGDGTGSAAEEAASSFVSGPAGGTTSDEGRTEASLAIRTLLAVVGVGLGASVLSALLLLI